MDIGRHEHGKMNFKIIQQRELDTSHICQEKKKGSDKE